MTAPGFTGSGLLQPASASSGAYSALRCSDPLLPQQGMSRPGARQHVLIQAIGVVETQSQQLVALERLVDQRLILYAGEELVIGAARPGQTS